MKFVFFALSLGLMAAAGTFAYHNADLVSLNYVLGVVELPLALFALLVFIAGALFSALLMVPHLMRGRQRIRRVNRACREQEQELKNLRKMPLDDVVATDH